ncbi:hypothetical protein Tco_0077002, partial [Tanacetum coccineum]
ILWYGYEHMSCIGNFESSAIDRVLHTWNDLGILQLVSEPTRLMY